MSKRHEFPSAAKGYVNKTETFEQSTHWSKVPVSQALNSRLLCLDSSNFLPANTTSSPRLPWAKGGTQNHHGILASTVRVNHDFLNILYELRIIIRTDQRCGMIQRYIPSAFAYTKMRRTPSATPVLDLLLHREGRMCWRVIHDQPENQFPQIPNFLNKSWVRFAYFYLTIEIEISYKYRSAMTAPISAKNDLLAVRPACGGMAYGSISMLSDSYLNIF